LPRHLTVPLWIFLITVFAVTGFGLLRGGQTSPAFFQILQLFTMPIVGFMFLYSLRGREDVPAIGAILVITAVVRAVLLLATYAATARSFADRDGFFVTTHSDTMLFAAAFSILIAASIERRDKHTIIRSVALGGVIAIAVLFNNRRLALIDLALAPACMYLALKPNRTKRRVTLLAWRRPRSQRTSAWAVRYPATTRSSSRPDGP
jgi:hypothetical protein